MWGAPPVKESDDSLRARLLYVAGDGEAATKRIAMAFDEKLDEIAERYNLRRRAR